MYFERAQIEGYFIEWNEIWAVKIRWMLLIYQQIDIIDLQCVIMYDFYKFK